MNHYIDSSLNAIIYILACFCLFYVGKLVYKIFNRRINIQDELVNKDNFAFSVSLVGYYLGLLLAIGGAFIGESKGLATDLLELAVYGVLAIILLNISGIINQKLILYKFSVEKEIITDRNTGTGVVIAANHVANGLILLGALSGEGGGIDTSLIFWATGQMALILTAKFYNLIVPYSIHEHIEKDNVAVGIGFAGALIAISNLIRNAIMHDFAGWRYAAIDLVVGVAVGIILLPLVRFLTDKVLIPGRKLTDEIVNQEEPNNGAALFEAFAYIGGSVLISWCI